MPQYNIRGISVDFPFPAYDCQLVYMEKVIHSLQDSKHALLESPTGTGKTMCLLCATLAWRKHLQQQYLDQKARMHAGEIVPSTEEVVVPQIFYLSRTHSQITKVVSELKRTAYADVKTALLGARSQLCVHPAVSFLKGAQQNNTCRNMVARHACNFHDNVEEGLHNPALTSRVMDIEEFLNTARAHTTCPYYLSRELHHSADIVFLPYNYVIDSVARRTMSLQLSGAILLFDEAHNLETICEESASFDLTLSDLRESIKELDTCATKMKMSISRGDRGNGMDSEQERMPSFARHDTEGEGESALDPDNFVQRCQILKDSIRSLEQHLASLTITNEKPFTQKGHVLLQLLNEKMHLQESNHGEACAILDQAAQLLAESDAQGDVVVVHRQKTQSACQSVAEALRIAFGSGSTRKPEQLAEYYKVHIHLTKAGGSFNAKEERTLSYWCMSGGVCMESLVNDLRVRTIVLTSGTLSPLNQLATELQIPFPIRLENPHIIGQQQIWVGAMAKSPNGILLNGSYKNRDRDDYKHELGNTLVNLSRVMPGGVLVFFPSYTVLQNCIAYWQSQNSCGQTANQPQPKVTDPTKAPPKGITMWERLSKNKQPVVEPRDATHCTNAINDFKTKVRDKRYQGAVFFAVCRGKVSEGLDFADDLGRAVIVTGLPYPALTDDRVVQKRAYLDEVIQRRPKNSTEPKEDGPVSGSDWYNTQAWRAVNQAIGRVIRHRLDYAAVVLLDERFTGKNAQDQLSGWMRPFMRIHTNMGETLLSLTRFFKTAPEYIQTLVKENKLVVPEPPPAAPTLHLTQNGTHLHPPAAPQKLITREGEAQPPAAVVAAVPATVSHSAAADVTAYMSSIKATLTADDNKAFQRLIKSYKDRTLDVENLVHQVRLLLSRGLRADYLKLMKEFIEFIPRMQREQYRQLLVTPLADIPVTPIKDTLKKEKAETKPFVGAAELKKMEKESSVEKERYSAAPPSPTFGIAKRPPQQQLQLMELKAPLKRPASPTKDTPTRSTSAKTIDLVKDTPKRSAPSPAAAAVTPFLPIPKRPKLQVVSASSAAPPLDPFEAVIQEHALLTRAASEEEHREAPKSPESPPAALPPAPAKPPVPLPAAAPASTAAKTVCPICQDAFKEPGSAPCGHVCCYECWSQLLATKLECPVCRAKVRLKNVRRLYLG